MKDAVRTLKLVIERRTSSKASDSPAIFSDEDAIDAFVLTLRFFIQNNEPTSIANMDKLFATLPLEPARIEAVAGSRRVVNEYLDQ